MCILRLATGALLLVSGPLVAQADERTEARLRNDCRLAAQVIRTGNPAPHRDWAYGVISQCAQSGPAVIAAAWRQPPNDEPTVQRLVWATARLRTRCVFAAVANAARERRNSLLVRTYAMEMLYSFAKPGLSLNVQDLLHPRGERPARISAVSGDGDVANAPDLGDAAPEVRAILGEIVASDPDPEIVRIARAVLDRV